MFCFSYKCVCAQEFDDLKSENSKLRQDLRDSAVIERDMKRVVQERNNLIRQFEMTTGSSNQLAQEQNKTIKDLMTRVEELQSENRNLAKQNEMTVQLCQKQDEALKELVKTTENLKLENQALHESISNRDKQAMNALNKVEALKRAVRSNRVAAQ